MLIPPLHSSWVDVPPVLPISSKIPWIQQSGYQNLSLVSYCEKTPFFFVLVLFLFFFFYRVGWQCAFLLLFTFYLDWFFFSRVCDLVSISPFLVFLFFFSLSFLSFSFFLSFFLFIFRRRPRRLFLSHLTKSTLFHTKIGLNSSYLFI